MNATQEYKQLNAAFTHLTIDVWEHQLLNIVHTDLCTLSEATIYEHIYYDFKKQATLTQHNHPSE